MKIHEYQAKELFRKYAIPVPQGAVAFTPEEARLRDVFVSLVSDAEAQDLRDTLEADRAAAQEAA